MIMMEEIDLNELEDRTGEMVIEIPIAGGETAIRTVGDNKSWNEKEAKEKSGHPAKGGRAEKDNKHADDGYDNDNDHDSDHGDNDEDQQQPGKSRIAKRRARPSHEFWKSWMWGGRMGLAAVAGGSLCLWGQWQQLEMEQLAFLIPLLTVLATGRTMLETRTVNLQLLKGLLLGGLIILVVGQLLFVFAGGEETLLRVLLGLTALVLTTALCLMKTMPPMQRKGALLAAVLPLLFCLTAFQSPDRQWTGSDMSWAWRATLQARTVGQVLLVVLASCCLTVLLFMLTPRRTASHLVRAELSDILERIRNLIGLLARVYADMDDRSFNMDLFLGVEVESRMHLAQLKRSLHHAGALFARVKMGFPYLWSQRDVQPLLNFLTCCQAVSDSLSGLIHAFAQHTAVSHSPLATGFTWVPLRRLVLPDVQALTHAMQQALSLLSVGFQSRHAAAAPALSSPPIDPFLSVHATLEALMHAYERARFVILNENAFPIETPTDQDDSSSEADVDSSDCDSQTPLHSHLPFASYLSPRRSPFRSSPARPQYGHFAARKPRVDEEESVEHKQNDAQANETSLKKSYREQQLNMYLTSYQPHHMLIFHLADLAENIEKLETFKEVLHVDTMLPCISCPRLVDIKSMPVRLWHLLLSCFFPLSLQRDDFIRSLAMGMAMLVACLVVLIPPAQEVFPYGFWAAVTVCFIIDPYSMTATFTTGMQRLVGTLMGAVLGCLARLIVIATSIDALILIFSFLIAAVAGFTRSSKHWSYAGLVCAFTSQIVLYSGIGNTTVDSLTTLVFARIELTFIGVMAAIFASLLWPHSARHLLHADTHAALSHLRHLFKQAFSVGLPQETSPSPSPSPVPTSPTVAHTPAPHTFTNLTATTSSLFPVSSPPALSATTPLPSSPSSFLEVSVHNPPAFNPPSFDQSNFLLFEKILSRQVQSLALAESEPLLWRSPLPSDNWNRLLAEERSLYESLQLIKPLLSYFHLVQLTECESSGVDSSLYFIRSFSQDIEQLKEQLMLATDTLIELFSPAFSPAVTLFQSRPTRSHSQLQEPQQAGFDLRKLATTPHHLNRALRHFDLHVSRTMRDYIAAMARGSAAVLPNHSILPLFSFLAISQTIVHSFQRFWLSVHELVHIDQSGS